MRRGQSLAVITAGAIPLAFAFLCLGVLGQQGLVNDEESHHKPTNSTDPKNCMENLDCSGDKFCDLRSTSCTDCGELHRNKKKFHSSWKDCGECFEEYSDSDGFCEPETQWVKIVASTIGGVVVGIAILFVVWLKITRGWVCYKPTPSHQNNHDEPEGVEVELITRHMTNSESCVLDLLRFFKLCASNNHFVPWFAILLADYHSIII